MKRNKDIAYVVLAVVFVLFNVISFVVPSVKSFTFWIAYVFTVLAFILQIGIWNYAFKGMNTLKSKFLGIPLISVGIVYLFIQIFVFAIFMVFPIASSWIALVVCVLIFGVATISLIGIETGKNEINHVEEKIEKKVFYIKLLQVDVEMLASAEQDADIKEALIKLTEKIRFSDPMSNDALTDIETRITDKVQELKTTDDKATIITVLDSLITERNKRIKILK